jgi:hypothetical protein
VARTFLQLVNDVLVRLRETTVVTNTSTAYSTLIGAFVNDAKREVEDAYQWSDLFDYCQFNSVVGQFVYETNGMTTRSGRTLGDRTKLWMDNVLNKPILINTTKNFESLLANEPIIMDLVNKQVALNQGTAGYNVPSMWQLYPTTQTLTAGLWNKEIYLYYPPQAIYTYNCYVVNPQDDLVNDTDVLLVPYAPVVQKAFMYALFDRGEEMGESLSLTATKVENTLSDAIAKDESNSAIYTAISIPYGGQY